MLIREDCFVFFLCHRRMFTVSNLGRKNNILEHILSFLCSVSKLASRCNEPIKTKKIKHR